jgi:hypothetical protein
LLTSGSHILFAYNQPLPCFGGRPRRSLTRSRVSRVYTSGGSAPCRHPLTHPEKDALIAAPTARLVLADERFAVQAASIAARLLARDRPRLPAYQKLINIKKNVHRDRRISGTPAVVPPTGNARIDGAGALG